MNHVEEYGFLNSFIVVANDGPDFNRLSWRIILLGRWVIEGRVEDKPRSILLLVINFENEALVLLLLWVVEPFVGGAPFQRISLSCPLLVSQLIRNMLGWINGVGVTDCQRLYKDRVVCHWPPYINEGEPSLHVFTDVFLSQFEAGVTLCLPQLFKPSWGRVLSVVAVDPDYGAGSLPSGPQVIQLGDR